MRTLSTDPSPVVPAVNDHFLAAPRHKLSVPTPGSRPFGSQPATSHQSPVTMLAEGTIEDDGSFSTSVRLDPLAPGSYDVQFTGTHRNGATLELTSRIVVGPGGEYMLIGDNIPIIR